MIPEYYGGWLSTTEVMKERNGSGALPSLVVLLEVGIW